jgi:hypothetical protein
MVALDGRCTEFEVGREQAVAGRLGRCGRRRIEAAEPAFVSWRVHGGEHGLVGARAEHVHGDGRHHVDRERGWLDAGVGEVPAAGRTGEPAVEAIHGHCVCQGVLDHPGGPLGAAVPAGTEQRQVLVELLCLAGLLDEDAAAELVLRVLRERKPDLTHRHRVPRLELEAGDVIAMPVGGDHHVEVGRLTGGGCDVGDDLGDDLADLVGGAAGWVHAAVDEHPPGAVVVVDVEQERVAEADVVHAEPDLPHGHL